MSAFSRIEDPKVITIIIAALISALLWLATWQSMSGMMMMDMGAMPAADGMAMPGAGDTKMSGMAADGGDAPMAMEGMTSDAMPMKPMKMDSMGGMMVPGDWSTGTILATMGMWVLMMAAMMLPAMAPVMSVYATVSSKEDRGARLALRIGLFTLSYFTLWAVFSLAAALLQLALRDSAWFTMGGTLAVPLLAGVLMIVAGGYQFTKLKDVCLRHCRHPLQYLLSHWKEGIAGAFPVGFRHGLYCFGCCIAFMGLMFVFGAMNVWAMAAIAIYFLAEKIVPGAETWGKIAGGLLVLGGFGMIGLNI